VLVGASRFAESFWSSNKRIKKDDEGGEKWREGGVRGVCIMTVLRNPQSTMVQTLSCLMTRYSATPISSWWHVTAKNLWGVRYTYAVPFWDHQASTFGSCVLAS
jgi:hypothetical protein